MSVVVIDISAPDDRVCNDCANYDISEAICGEEYEVYATCIEDIMSDPYLYAAVNSTIAYEYHLKKLRDAILVYELSLEGT